jgi:hypothetical protein
VECPQRDGTGSSAIGFTRTAALAHVAEWHNPKTGACVIVPAMRVPFVRVGRELSGASFSPASRKLICCNAPDAARSGGT